MNSKEYFSRENFINNVRKACAENGWEIDKLEDDNAIINCYLDSGKEKTLFIFLKDLICEFQTPVIPGFKAIRDIPHSTSSFLLELNSNAEIGFWSILNVGDTFYYCIRHIIETPLLDYNYFVAISRILIKTCDKVEELMNK